MTSATDGAEHAIHESAFTAGIHRGCYQSVCGRDVYPRAMTAPPGRRCPACSYGMAASPPENWSARVLGALGRHET